MTSDRQKPGVAFWVTVVLVAMLVGYPMSFGPACWWFTRSTTREGTTVVMGSTQHYVPRFYWPIGWLAARGPTPVVRAIGWYGTLRYRWVLVPTDFAETEFVSLPRR